MSEIKWFLLLLAVGFLILLFRHIQLKKQIRNLSGQVKEWNRGNSGQMIDISLMDKDLEHLAAILNLYNIRQRQAVAKTLRHEEHLKESVANISHDLRTPLTVILGHLQLLQKEDLEPAQAKRIAVVLHKAEKMKELVEAFYDLSVLEEQQTVPSKETFNFSNMLIDLITEHAPALEKKNIIPEIMLMYSKEANNRKQEIDRQHHTIPNQRANDKHHGNVYNLLFRYGKVRSQNMEKLKSSFPTFCKRTFPQLHKIASYAHYAQCRLLRKPSHFIIYSRK